MYKSSSFTFLYEFIFIPLMLTGFAFGTVISFIQSDESGIAWSYQMVLTGLWATFWLTLMSLRLRRIEATRESFVIKSFGKRKTVNYSDIEWISQLAMVNPAMISMKYYDRETEETKRILIMPSMQSQMFSFSLLTESDLTLFLRENITVARPSYSKDNEPSRWIPLGLIFLSGIPVFLFQLLIFQNIFG